MVFSIGMPAESHGIKHIDYALPARKHTSMYLMHKYFARKPHNVVAEYIKHYSKNDDIVLDPFAGSGVTAIEALKYGRKAIAIDLDPIAVFITRMTAIPVDLTTLERTYEEIRNDVKSQILNLYETRCEKCKTKTFATHIIWDTDENTKIEKPIKIWYHCKKCKRRGFCEKKPDKADFEQLRKIEETKFRFWYPKNELIWNTRVNVHRGECVDDLFSKRNLLALSILFDRIEKISNDTIKNMMRFTFTSSLAQASKLIPVVHEGKECKSWTVRGYWIPPKHFEINVWNCFKERFKKIMRGKDESNHLVGKHFKEAKKFEDLLEDKTILISNQSALDLSNIPNNSIDYIFTDPPYGDSVPYLELGYMWSSWLGFKPNFEDEIIISDSPRRKNKNIEEYNRMLIQAFKECYRVLKPNNWLTVTFHNTDIEIYNSIIQDVLFAGFELDKILYQPPARASAKSLLHPYGSAVGDYYIRFEKPETPRKMLTEKQVDVMRFEKIVVESVKKIIAQRGEPVTYNDVLKSIYIDLDKQGYLLAAKSEDIQKIINKFKDKEFVFLKGQGWWFKEPEKYLLHIVPLHDRVEQAVVQTLRRKFKVSFDDILQEIFITFKNALTPEPTKVRAFLEEYAKKTKGGMWQLKPQVEARVREHSQMIGHLIEIGKKLGFNTFVGLKEQGDIYNGQPLSSISDPVKMSMLKDNLDHVQMIDVLWLRNNGEVEYSFDVEYTTGITEAITRGSYIPTKKTKRFLVIPEEREKTLYKKTNAPLFKDRVEGYHWKFIFFKDLTEFFDNSKHKKQISIDEFEKIGKDLKLEREKQQSLTTYS